MKKRRFLLQNKNFLICCISVAQNNATNHFFKGLFERGFKKMTLTKKEKDFCRYFALCRNHREAAAKAGYTFPDKAGIRLLSKESVNDEIDAIGENLRRAAIAADGFRRIAFGSVTDAVRLVLGQYEQSEVETLDLFMVSEIKLSKTGGIEVKFFDRIKALESLAEISELTSGEGAVPFIDAIFKGAESISDVVRSECDEL